MNSIELNLFSNRLDAICDEMGIVLRNAAFSPNIKDRLDFSCAIFDVGGGMVAQAAHIPVHLGSMAFAMQDLVGLVDWQDGDQMIVNDPYMGGTHLPDITLIAPVFHQASLQAFVVNRAHYADIGSETPGSMPISSSLSEEGMLISPVLLVKAAVMQDKVLDSLLTEIRNPDAFLGDLSAQMSANAAGKAGLISNAENQKDDFLSKGFDDLNAYANKLATASLSKLPNGEYSFVDFMDDDGQGNTDLKIQLKLSINNGHIVADFTGTCDQVDGNVNCPLSVVAAGVYYVFRCLMPKQTPASKGAFENIKIIAVKGSLVNAEFPAAVVAGNVETSSRIVDVVIGALSQALPDLLPAASQGSMNNIAMGADAAHGRRGWDYYETIGGGMGASKGRNGLSAVQTHMTNTLNTPIEVLESNYPLRLSRYQLRNNSGGKGNKKGGDGIIREYEFLDDAQFSLLTERRHYQPWGIEGGEGAQVGVNLLNNQKIPGKFHTHVKAGDKLTIKTPGGGGFGKQK